MIFAKLGLGFTWDQCFDCIMALWPLFLIPALLGLWWAWNLWGAWGKRLGLLTAEGDRLRGGINGLNEKITGLRADEEERKRIAATRNLEATAAIGVAAAAGAGAVALAGAGDAEIEEEPEPDRPADVSGYSGYLGQYEGDNVEAQVQPGVIFTSAPSCIDDLKEISGVGPALEKTLNENGVYRFQQVADWNEYNVWYFNKIISFPGRIQRDEWIKQAGGLAQDSKCRPGYVDPAIAEAEAKAKAKAKADEDARIAAEAEAKAKADEEARIAAEAEAKAKADEEARLAAEAETKAKAEEEEKSSAAGIAAGAVGVAGLAGAAALAAGDDEEEAPAEIEEEPEPDRPSDVSGYSSYLGQYEGESVEAQVQPGVVFTSRPSCVDDLKEISGVGPKLEETLNENGVYRFQQVADWNEYNIWYFNKIMAFPGRIQRDEWIDQANKLAKDSKCLGGDQSADGTSSSGLTPLSGDLAKEFEGESNVGYDDQIGVVYSSKPGEVDDLTEISGVGDVLEGRLNDYGVYRFKQIANWDGKHVDEFGNRLEFPGRIEREEWIPQAKRLSAAGEMDAEPEPDRPADVSGYSSYLSQYEGQPVEAQIQPGVVFTSAPSCADDLTEIKGIGKVLNKTLNDNGVYRFQQIADWNEYNIWFFNDIMAFPGRIQRDEWIAQAKSLAPDSKCLAEGLDEEPEPDRPSDVSGYQANLAKYEGEPVEAQVQPGVVFTSWPDCSDDLKQIKGVGPVLEKTMKENGVHRFTQIADWNEYNIWYFNKIMAFPGRIQRDEWIAQAGDLAKTSKCSGSGDSVDAGGGEGEHFSHTSTKGSLFYLYSRQQKLKNSDKEVTLYYFSKDPDHPKGVKVYGIPEGRKVAETATGMLVLKKTDK